MTAGQRGEFARRAQEVANRFALVIDEVEQLAWDLHKVGAYERVAALHKERRRHEETANLVERAIDHIYFAKVLIQSIRAAGEPPRFR